MQNEHYYNLQFTFSPTPYSLTTVHYLEFTKILSCFNTRMLEHVYVFLEERDRCALAIATRATKDVYHAYNKNKQRSRSDSDCCVCCFKTEIFDNGPCPEILYEIIKDSEIDNKYTCCSQKCASKLLSNYLKLPGTHITVNIS